MKLIKVSGTYAPIIVGSADDSERTSTTPDFSNYTNVPDLYTRVAYRNSATDTGTGALGSHLKTTYAAYISSTQVADTYQGKVKYTIVHPSTTGLMSYKITYDKNTTDTVSNLPVPQPGESSDGSAILSSTKPTRTNYGFYGWCTTVPVGLTCNGTTYKAGDSIPLTSGTENDITFMPYGEVLLA